VDTDFSVAEIRSHVVPYFEDVLEGLSLAANAGKPTFRVGIYGSGLSCQLLKENFALAELSWLALATGWRGSKSYDTWNLEQSQPSGDLCTLGMASEANESRGDFGAFRPIGAEVTAENGALMRVTASELYLRFVPSTQGNVPIIRLHEGQEVRLLGDAERKRPANPPCPA
jgi:hypothetical protein